MIYSILEQHKALKKGECLKIIALGDYTTYINKSDIIKPTGQPQILRIVGINGRSVSLNCNHIIVACTIQEGWRH